MIEHTKNNRAGASLPLIQCNVPLADKNWFKTGGNARYFAAPTTSAEFQEAILFAHEKNLPIFLLGKGANILISDDGFDGLVIQPNMVSARIIEQSESEVLIEADAGMGMPELITWCLDNHILGLEEFSGIPGTVGGSVFINLHYFEFLLSQFIVAAEVIEKSTGHCMTVGNSWFNFGYNYSTLHNNEHYLISATFKLRTGTPAEVEFGRGRHAEIIRHRAARYPKSNTCGSFFRNFYDHEVTIESNGKKMIFVAYYLDKLGVKGQLAVGKAHVSYQHANMIVTQPGATTSDIIELARQMQQKVLDAFGILPQAECRLVGFKEYPLLQKS